jgi:hypothetical protein
MPRKIHGAINAEGLDKRRALKIARESRAAGVFPLHAETHLLRRDASLSIPALRGALAEDERDRGRITWNLDPRVRERLAETLEWLYERLPESFIFEAVWDIEPTEKYVSRAELLRIVEGDRIEINTCYRVEAAGAPPM